MANIRILYTNNTIIFLQGVQPTWPLFYSGAAYWAQNPIMQIFV